LAHQNVVVDKRFDGGIRVTIDSRGPDGFMLSQLIARSA
jgi:hypothetical protein